MRKWLGVILMLSVFAVGQRTAVEKDTQTISVSGSSLLFQDTIGSQTNQFEMVVAGGPATVTVNVFGCMRSNTCSASLVSSSSTTNVLIPVTGGPYDYYKVTGSWTGGGTVTLTFNRTGSSARSNNGGAASSVAFSGITSGVNTQAAMQVGNGASLQPLNFGRNISTSSWLYNTDPEPSTGPSTWTAANSGGTLQTAHTYCLEWTLVSVVGETTPTAEVCHQPPFFAGTCSGNACTIALSAPTLPSGFTGYTVYARDQTAAQSQQQIAGCVNISGTCTFGSISTTSSPPTINAVMPLPALAKTSVCPANVTPTVWVPDANGNLNSQTYLSEFFDTTAAGGGPTNASDAGVLVDCRPRWFSDNPTDPPGGKNAFFLVDHLYGGSGLHAGNQDRTVWLNGQNPANDATTRYGLEVLQAELDFNCNGCTINGSPDGEITSGSFQLNTAGASTNWTTTGYSTNAIQGRVFRNGAGFDIAGINAVYGNVTNGNATAPAGGTLAALKGVFDGTVNASNISGIGLSITGPATTGRFGRSIGAYFAASFTPSAFGGNTDYLIRNDKHNWHSLINGIVGVTGIKNTDLGSFPVDASMNLTGALATAQIAASWTPGYAASCSGGASTYGYQFVAVDQNGGQVASGTFSCNTGVNPLTAPNPATLNPGAGVATSAVYQQAKSIDVYRTSGPMGTGKIGSLSCNFNIPINSCSAFTDTGIAAGAAMPTLNTTGSNNAYLFGTTTNCAATGSAASPSVAACGSASAGSFSCATNAVNTCTVNTTAVTANSEIFISQREDTTTGTRLGVTCNTTASVVVADENITAVVAGTSFSFGLTQPVTNPDCFSYFIVNQ